MTDYKPGTFAMVTLDSGERVRAMRLEDEDAWRTQDDIWLDRRDGTETVTEVRPLVVLDPDDVEQVKTLRDWLGSLNYYGTIGQLQSSLRQMTRPPKPPEPQGLGAVVEDADGSLLVRIDSHQAPWACTGGSRWVWRDIDAVRVLSDGWEPKP